MGNCLPVLHRMLLLSVRHELSEITATNADLKQSYGLLMNRTNTDRHSCDIFHTFCAKVNIRTATNNAFHSKLNFSIAYANYIKQIDILFDRSSPNES